MLGSVYVDFDGTIVPTDPTDRLFERVGAPTWRERDCQRQQGRRTAGECMAQEVDVLRATPEATVELLSTIEIDRQFPAFVDLCRAWDLKVMVVSDGLDRVVEHLLQAAGLQLPFFANRLQWLGDDRWRLQFPYAHDCAAALGNCKCSHRSWAGGALDIVVGDGQSDFCIAQRSHLVLAKRRLAAHCRWHRITHYPVTNFADATACLRGWLARNARQSA